MSERKGTKALELWCKRLVRDCPEIRIDNMTTSWRNGMAFCALVHHFRPDLIDMSKLKPENIYENNQLAFSVAEKHLGIPALLDPEDMVENDVPDRLSILTYLSQFYQRLGHTVNTKVTESESKSKATVEPTQPPAPIKFGKVGLDKCTACSLPVYLAQRLMVSHKLYHRRCFRCAKCSGHLNPKNYHVIDGSEFSCDSCKNEKTLLKYLNNNDQMGMLAFSDSTDAKLDLSKEDIVSPKAKSRPSSILEKISMFEKNDKDSMDSKVSNLTIKDSTNTRHKELSETNESQNENDSKHITDSLNVMSLEIENIIPKTPDKVYKSSIDKFNFLQTQLTGDSLIDNDKTAQNIEDKSIKHKDDEYIISDICENANKIPDEMKAPKDPSGYDIDEAYISAREDVNITDDLRIAKIPATTNLSTVEKDSSDDSKITDVPTSPIKEIPLVEEKELAVKDMSKADEIPISVPPRKKEPSGKNISRGEEETISVPPRRKKQNATEKATAVKTEVVPKVEPKLYPDHLNPFSDDEEEEEPSKSGAKKESTNPFGSTDEEDDEVPPILPPPKVPGIDTSTPVKRLIAVNPFWSDGEEPSTDEEEEHSRSSKGRYSSLAASTPNLPGSTPRRKKPRAPPPPVITVSEAARDHATSMDDVASISSLSSYNSTVHSDQKSYEKSTPRLKKRPAPSPLNSLSTVSGYGGSIEKGIDTSDVKSTSGFDVSKKKGPAPGLPLPERREVKLQMSPEELQVQLDLLETQQLGLERQGVLIERMIRDKCEGDEASTVPQEEVEDLVIQLCELVNEKNDLFRKQTELMYIRRQQRLEQEQADIEHEIRIIQSRPAVNRIDADKAREEQLVSRLVEIVRMRDELVQQLDAERRRERQEDLAIAASIASKRASRNSDSNSSSMKSAEASTTTTPKKNKVKEKVKKQLKKAKHTLIHKKKDDSGDRKESKEEKVEKEKKSK